MAIFGDYCTIFWQNRPKVTLSELFGVERWLSTFWKLYEQGYHLRKYKRKRFYPSPYPLTTCDVLNVHKG